MATTTTKKSATKKSPTKKAATKKSATKRSDGKKADTKKSDGKKKTASKKASPAKHPDALAVLKADHKRVSDLFDKFEGVGEKAHKSRESTVAKIIKELSVHAGIEEAVFYPAVRERFAAADQPMVLEALEEHHLVKLTLNELQAMTSKSERYTAKVTVLRELVDHHVKEEESDLFKEVRKLFTRSELVDLGEEIDAARASAPTRPHPVAPDTPPGNIVSNVVAAPLDAAADLTAKAAKAVRKVTS